MGCCFCRSQAPLLFLSLAQECVYVCLYSSSFVPVLASLFSLLPSVPTDVMPELAGCCGICVVSLAYAPALLQLFIAIVFI